jgi:hypothetical protein
MPVPRVRVDRAVRVWVALCEGEAGLAPTVRGARAGGGWAMPGPRVWVDRAVGVRVALCEGEAGLAPTGTRPPVGLVHARVRGCGLIARLARGWRCARARHGLGPYGRGRGRRWGLGHARVPPVGVGPCPVPRVRVDREVRARVALCEGEAGLAPTGTWPPVGVGPCPVPRVRVDREVRARVTLCDGEACVLAPRSGAREPVGAGPCPARGCGWHARSACRLRRQGRRELAPTVWRCAPPARAIGLKLRPVLADAG